MPRSSLDEKESTEATAWLGLGILGVILFVLGVYTPALHPLPYASYLDILLAIVGGATAVYGFTQYYDERVVQAKRPRPRPLRGRARQIAIAPSLEVYDPRTATSAHAAEEPREPTEGP